MPLRLIVALTYVIVPGIGLWFLEWDWRMVLLLYFLENVTQGVVGFIRVARLLADDTQGAPGVAEPWKLASGFLIPYALFLAILGSYVWAVTVGTPGQTDLPRIDWPLVLSIWGVLGLVQVLVALLDKTVPEGFGEIIGFAYLKVILFPLLAVVLGATGQAGVGIGLVVCHLLIDVWELSFHERRRTRRSEYMGVRVQSTGVHALPGATTTPAPTPPAP